MLRMVPLPRFAGEESTSALLLPERVAGIHLAENRFSRRRLWPDAPLPGDYREGVAGGRRGAIERHAHSHHADRYEALARGGARPRRIFGAVLPACAVVQVSGFVEP